MDLAGKFSRSFIHPQITKYVHDIYLLVENNGAVEEEHNHLVEGENGADEQDHHVQVEEEGIFNLNMNSSKFLLFVYPS